MYSEKYTLAERLEAAQRDLGGTKPGRDEPKPDDNHVTESEDDAQ